MGEGEDVAPFGEDFGDGEKAMKNERNRGMEQDDERVG